MPIFEHGDTRLHYAESGEGFPILLFAPGGMRSAAAFWTRSAWNPVEALAPHFRVIAMDQRNAGRSTAPINGADGWASYTGDHLALLDGLGIERCHLLGGCIGGSYSLGLMEAAPDRVSAAVLQQPIGADGDNRQAFYDMFDGWADDLREATPDMSDEDWSRFRSSMYDADFVFNVSREFVAGCKTPMLVLMGDDLYHPSSISREIARTAPEAELIELWKEPEVVEAAVEKVIAFLKRHTP
jgi:pimeloyl-ACP methyl ester carboxylesterase